jgi:hypothetical protein
LQKKGEKSRSSFGAAFLFFVACHCERSEAIFPSRLPNVSKRQGKIASLRSQ